MLVYDSMTFTCIELEYAQWQQHMALLDLSDERGIDGTYQKFVVKNCHFYVILDTLKALATHRDA